MVARTREHGFTIAEVVVTITVVSLFLTVFFQIYMTAENQKQTALLNAAANDTSQTNLRKISSKTNMPSTTPACDDTNNGSANPNNGQRNPALNPTINPSTDPLAGSVIPMVPYSTTPPANTIMAESLNTTALPSTSTQTMLVMYPFGCNINMPAKIISVVTYGTSSSQKAVHEAYIN